MQSNALFNVTLVASVITFASVNTTSAQVVAPEQYFGHPIAADYKLDRWSKIVSYFQLLDGSSDRIQVEEIGRTTEDRPMVLAIISSEANLRDIKLHRDNQRRLADPRRIENSTDEAPLIRDSKIAVLINCNLHSTEIASSQLAIEFAHELVTSEAPQIREILERVIVLLVPSANPDGLDLVVDWYESTLGKPWEGAGLPWLYQKYAGHDNNRDWFMLALQETRLLTRVLYEQWFPTIVYDIHQFGSSGARFVIPPMHDPKNPVVPPLIDQTQMLIGGHIATELARQNKRGVLHGALFDNWWVGGFRTTPHRHNMVAILTEAASPNLASPMFLEKSHLQGGGRGMPDYQTRVNFPDPWPGGWWRLRDVVDYERIACLSLLTLAARYRDTFQSNYLHLGREAIRRGNSEPPYAWVVPAEQHDPGSTQRLLEIMRATGVEVHQANQPFAADGASYSAGSHILYCGQPYRAHLIDMFELQTYPGHLKTSGGDRQLPYDIAGWTLPLQMGVRHAAVGQPFEAQVVRRDVIEVPQPTFEGPNEAANWLVRSGPNDLHRLTNRLYRANTQFEVVAPSGTGLENSGLENSGPSASGPGNSARSKSPGSLLIKRDSLPRDYSSVFAGLAVHVERTNDSLPNTIRRRRPRVALYKSWVASRDEGWTRRVLDEFEFQYESITNDRIRAGGLASQFDCLILPSLDVESLIDGEAPDTTAPQYTGGIGLRGIMALQEFTKDGGTLVCIDESCNLPIKRFNIPVKNILENRSRDEFSCPGSILRVAVDTSHPLGFGLPSIVSAWFNDSQAFELDQLDAKRPPAAAENIRSAAGIKTEPRTAADLYRARIVARYGDSIVLESGFLLGEKLIADKAAVVEVRYGKGTIYLLGFRVQHRAQPHGTFQFLFNAIQQSAW